MRRVRDLKSGFTKLPRGSIYTTIRELGPKIPYNGRNSASQFPNGCICGPFGLGWGGTSRAQTIYGQGVGGREYGEHKKAFSRVVLTSFKVRIL